MGWWSHKHTQTRMDKMSHQKQSVTLGQKMSQNGKKEHKIHQVKMLQMNKMSLMDEMSQLWDKWAKKHIRKNCKTGMKYHRRG
jgi:hypothetical protein